MVKYVELNGNKYPVGFSIRELFGVCARRNKSLEELLAMLMSTNKGMSAETYEVALDLCRTALNVGARREGVDARFTLDDLDDIFSADISALETMVEAIVETINAPQVFPMPSRSTAKPRRKGK